MPGFGTCSACGQRTEIDDEINQPSDGSYLIHRCTDPECPRYMEQQSSAIDWQEDYDDYDD